MADETTKFEELLAHERERFVEEELRERYAPTHKTHYSTFVHIVSILSCTISKRTPVVMCLVYLKCFLYSAAHRTIGAENVLCTHEVLISGRARAV
jgi:hypothetical protein